MHHPAASPANGALHGVAGKLVAHRVRRTFVKHHGDIAAEGELDLDGRFRGELVRIAVEVRLEDDTVFGDAAKAAETEDLKSAGIGEDGAGPGHEAMEAAHFPDRFVSRAQEEV